MLQIHKNEEVGDILAFLTGQDEVDMACFSLIEEAKSFKKTGKYDSLLVLPLYSALPPRDQVIFKLLNLKLCFFYINILASSV